MANQYVRDLSVNIRRGLREKVRRGIYAWKAPLGYFNEPRLRTVEPHPENFKKMKRLLERFATGKYTLTAIQREMTKAGLVGERSKKPLPISSIHNLLKNPFYYGVFYCKGEMHQGAHTPMLSKETWDAVQRARIAVAKPQKKFNDKGFLFLGLATCGFCGHCITAERHVKKSGLRYSYYRCTHKNKRQRCESRSFIRQEAFAAEVKRNAQLITLPDEWKERFLAKVETWEGEESAAKQQEIDRSKAELAATKVKIDRLNTGFTDGSIDLAEFKELKNPLIPKKVELEGRLIALESSKSKRLEPLRSWIFEASSLEKTVSEDNWGEMKSFLQKVGSNRILRGESVTVSFIKPWDSLAQTNLAVLRTADFSEQCEKWWR